jgi:hypothetical protein
VGRKRAPWMVETGFPPPKKAPTVFGIFVWRGDGRYRIENAIRTFKRRFAADRFAEKDLTGTWVVREVDAPE